MKEFTSFPKMARLSRECVITEKIDGTNAQICIVPTTELFSGLEYPEATVIEDFSIPGSVGMFVGSRNRWIQPGNDNYGFAAWAKENFAELKKLGPGQHFGEWWGAGIQRGYGLTEKRFSLFNVGRWAPAHGDEYGPGVYEFYKDGVVEMSKNGPDCCYVVPTLYRGDFSTEAIGGVLVHLDKTGSAAAPGFRDPEGIVIYHEAAKVCFKKTIKDDESPKGKITA